MEETSTFLHAIKFLKIYGWEDYFGRKVSSIREREARMLKKYQVIIEIVCGVGGTIVFITSFFAFIIKDSNGGLTLPIMLAITQMMGLLAQYNEDLSAGIECFIQINITFNRFLDVYQQ